MANDVCSNCEDMISAEEYRAGSKNGFCVVCEHIRNTPEQRKERREQKQMERLKA